MSEDEAPPPPGYPWDQEGDFTLIKPSVERESAAAEETRVINAVTREQPGRYEVRGELGRGGIGRVVQALDRHLGREVAIKELQMGFSVDLPGSADDPAISRFVREARITGRLEHPSIIPIYELGKRSDGSLYYAMKRIKGRTLKEALDESTGLSDRMRLLSNFVDVANAIAFAHSKGVIHRDIKPQNVMLGEFGETVVLDWGLTKLTNEADSSGTIIRMLPVEHSGTQTGEAMGTPAYMSPEQVNGQIAQVDERSDVWSLGVVLFEILTGEQLFKGPDARAIMFAVAEAPIPSPSSLVPEIAPDLSAIVTKAVTRKPAERYANAAELVEDLTSYVSGGRVSAYRYSAVELVRRFFYEHRALALGVSAVLLSIVVGAAVSLAQRAQAIENRIEAQRNLAAAHLQKADQLLAETNHRAASIHASAALRELSLSGASRDHPRVLRGMAALTRAEGLGTATLESTMPIAPACAGLAGVDGRSIFIATEDQELLVVDAEDQRVTRRYPLNECSKRLAQSANGSLLIATRVDRPPVLIDRTRGTAEPLAIDGAFAEGAFGRDGLYLLEAERGVERYALGNLQLQEQWAVDNPRTMLLLDNRRTLVVGTRFGRVVFIDLETGARTESKPLESTIYALSSDRSQAKLAVGGYEGDLVLMDVATGEELGRMKRDDMVYRASMHPSGRFLAASYAANTEIWDLDTLLRREHLPLASDAERLMFFDRDGRRLFSVGREPSLETWRFVPPRPRVELDRHVLGVLAAARGDDFDITIDLQHTVRLWRDGSELWSRTAAYASKAVSTGRGTFATLSPRGEVLLWDRNGVVRRLHADEGPSRTTRFAIASDTRSLAWTTPAGGVEWYDLAGEGVRARFSPQQPGVRVASATFTTEGDLVLGTDAGGVILLHRDSGSIEWSVDDVHAGDVMALDSSPTHGLVTAGKDGHVRMLDPASGAIQKSLGPLGPIEMLDVDPQSERALIRTSAKQIMLLKLGSGKIMLSFENDRYELVSMFGPEPNSISYSSGTSLRMLTLPTDFDALYGDADRRLAKSQRNAGLVLDEFDLRAMPLDVLRAEGD